MAKIRKNITIEPALYEAVVKLAREQQRSFTNMVEVILAAYPGLKK